MVFRSSMSCQFLSTLSLRRATALVGLDLVGQMDFYPRSPCGERRGQFIGQQGQTDFYPRSPCGERLLFQARKRTKQNISIHALLAESDLAGPSGPAFLYRFLSTLSLRRATEEITTMNIDVTISIHALLAESDSLSLPSRAVWIISIHALLAESDGQLPTTQPPRRYF